jgi:glutamine---fructose-6-phosphate transaminase (isomerizing)
MPETCFATPLLRPESPLDEHARQLIQSIYEKEQAKALVQPTDDPLDPKRRKMVEHTRVEIWQQPDIIQKNLEIERKAILETADWFACHPIDQIYLTGCGDSIASMMAVRLFYEEFLGIHCEPVQALDFTYYYHRPVNPRTLVIMLSSSGRTVRTVEAMLIARAKGALTLTLSNTPGSPLMVESNRGILIHAERKGWPTQSSTAAMAILYQFGIDLARRRGIPAATLDRIQANLAEIPEKTYRSLQQTSTGIQEVAEEEAEKRMYLFTGGGPAFASALFGAAKIKECTPDQALAIPLEEFHHYNSQKIGDPLFLSVPDGPSIPRSLDTAREGRRLGGQIYSVVDQNNHALDESSNRVFEVANVPEVLAPFTHTMPLQLFAYYAAVAKFQRAEEKAQPGI